MEKEEMIALVRNIMECEYASEEEQDRDLELLKRNALDPGALDYIFWPPRDSSGNFIEFSPEEIVDKIFSYRPIQLP
ncbi:MAG: bacteriocin immunity protein [Micrococcales bacterium]|nr:bacteriocin immunity protein [Micrococcales bacterium]MCL2667816.1 bacteriocin immunity protein [Micrococcales bacterium]